MRVAALYDIHGNLPALEAVLDDVGAARVDLIVVGGDVLPGPMPRETLARLQDLTIPARFICGNGDLAVLAQIDAVDSNAVAYWGTTSDAPLPEPLKEALRWTAKEVRDDYELVLRTWARTFAIWIDGVGDVLFCHATPRSETESFTRLTPEAPLLPVFEGLKASLVVCGHTHMQFDRMIGRVRVVNAGSVGMPFGRPGAEWALLGPDVELRHTSYDLADAASRVRAAAYPQAASTAAAILSPASETSMLDAFTNASF